MSEPFLVGMTDSAKTALQKIRRQQGRFRQWHVDTSLDYGYAWGVSLKVGTFWHRIRLTGPSRNNRMLMATKRRMNKAMRSASFQRNARHKRNQARHFGVRKTYSVFR